MSIGLDLGTTQFRSLRIADNELIGRQCRAVYAVLSDTANHRRLLEQSGAKFASCGGDIVLFGDSALEWSNLLDLSVVSLLPGGRVPQSDPVARQLLTLMIDAVLPPAERQGDVCCMTVPGGHDIHQAGLPYDVRLFKQLVALRGYQPKLISPGQAVVLAELAAASFSGIGICFGAGNCQIGVIHCGRELASCSFDECPVDHSADGVTPTSSNAAIEPILAERTLHAARDHVLVRGLTETLTAAREELDRRGALRWLAQPTHVVCTGRPTSEPDFPKLFAQVWSSLEWPMKIGELRVTADAIYSVARGCLIQSRLESRDDQHRAA